MPVSAPTERKVKEKSVPAAYYWPESLHKKIQLHQAKMFTVLKRKVNFDEAIAHYVANTESPDVAIE